MKSDRKSMGQLVTGRKFATLGRDAGTCRQAISAARCASHRTPKERITNKLSICYLAISLQEAKRHSWAAFPHANKTATFPQQTSQ